MRKKEKKRKRKISTLIFQNTCYGTYYSLFFIGDRSTQDVTVEDVKNAMTKYFLPIFSSSSSVIAASCAPSLSSKLEEQFKGMGYEVEIRELPTTEGAGAGEDGYSSGSGSGTGTYESDGEEGSESGSEMSTGTA